MTDTTTQTRVLAVPELTSTDDTLTAALAYAAAGFYVLPVRMSTKHPGSVVGVGWQHKSSRDPEQIVAWFAGTDHGIALHMGRSGGVAFDVDAPDKLPTVLFEAIRDTTPPYQSTRADVPGRGHYLFTVPPDRALGNGVGQLDGSFGEIRGRNGIVVVAPSVHENTADGGRYQWQTTGPLPVLPASVADLLVDSGDDVDAATDAQVEAFLSEHTDATRPELLDVWCSTFANKVAAGESRHARMVSILAGALKEARAGYFGARTAAEALQVAFLAAVARSPVGKQGNARAGSQARGEWAAILAWAVAVAQAADLDDVRRRTQAMVPDVAAWLAEHESQPVPPEPDAIALFWSARPSLQHVYDTARARRAAPWAVLGVVLARVIVSTPPHLVLPPLVGTDASLNLFVAVVGASGDGKGAASGAAGDAFGMPAVTAFPVGSGEGLTHLFVKRDKGVVVQHTTSVLAEVGEVDTLAALTSRQGATLQPVLRQAYMGELFGFGYADPSKRLVVAAHAYRLSLIVGVQPKRAGTLLDDADGGTPQRFVWLPAVDRDSPDTVPTLPARLPWNVPTLPKHDADGKVRVAVCKVAREAVDGARLDRLRGNSDALDGHALLARLKVAAALGLLDGHIGVTPEDWRLAGTVMAVSDATRGRIVAEVTASHRTSNLARGMAEADRAEIVAERAEGAATVRLGKRLARTIGAAGADGIPGAALRKTLASRDRHLLDDALDTLLNAGRIVAEDVAPDPAGGGGIGRRYRVNRGAS